MAEHSAVNRRVVGSSPTWGANQKQLSFLLNCFFVVLNCITSTGFAKSSRFLPLLMPKKRQKTNRVRSHFRHDLLRLEAIAHAGDFTQFLYVKKRCRAFRSAAFVFHFWITSGFHQATSDTDVPQSRKGCNFFQVPLPSFYSPFYVCGEFCPDKIIFNKNKTLRRKIVSAKGDYTYRGTTFIDL